MTAVRSRESINEIDWLTQTFQPKSKWMMALLNVLGQPSLYLLAVQCRMDVSNGFTRAEDECRGRSCGTNVSGFYTSMKRGTYSSVYFERCSLRFHSVQLAPGTLKWPGTKLFSKAVFHVNALPPSLE